MNTKRILIITLIIVLSTGLYAQEFVGRELDTRRIDEASGLALSKINPGILYSHNDSGGEASVFAINTDGELIAEIIVPGLRNRDWEDIATAIDPGDGRAYIYVGEIGDNRAVYPSIYIYRIPEPKLTDSLISAETVEIFEINYEDGARDAEALFVDPQTGDIYIISKREEKVGIYRLAHPLKSDELNLAIRLGEVDMSWVTAADISSDGSKILVKNYTEIRLFERAEGESIAEALMGEGKKMPYEIEPQGEAICFDKADKGYFTLSEAVGDAAQILYYYSD